MSLQRLLWTLVAIAVITAYSIGATGRAADPPSAAALAAVAGCPPATAHPVRNGREELACTEHGFHVVVRTFDTDAQRDAWVHDLSFDVAAAVLTDTAGGYVTGERWAVETGDAAALDRLNTLAGGWWL